MHIQEVRMHPFFAIWIWMVLTPHLANNIVFGGL
jgi:hypothetical protein